MARPELLRHRKFRRLVATLGLPPPYVLGHLEWLWQTCYETGDPFLGDSTDVELGAQWQGEPSKFTQAMIEAGGPGGAGFIEPAPQGGYQIHDLLENAPSYVKDRFRKRQERKGLVRPGPGHAESLPGQPQSIPGLGQDTFGPVQDHPGCRKDAPGPSSDMPGGVQDSPGQTGTRPPMSGTPESLFLSPNTLNPLESSKELDPSTEREPHDPSTRFDGTHEAGNSRDLSSPPPVRPASREGRLRPLGEIAAALTRGLSPDQQRQMITGFIEQFDDWLKGPNCPEGLTHKQIWSLVEAGLTLEAARSARSKYEHAARKTPVQRPGALAYKLLEDELDPDAGRELRAEVATRKREFRERRTEGAQP